MQPQTEWLFLLMPLAAFLYASVGHGGASSYLMLLSWFGFLPETIRPGALVLNLAVAGMAFLAFRKKETFDWRLFLWLIAGSFPAAFLGAGIKIDPVNYRIVLGLLLLFPVVRLFGWIKERKAEPIPFSNLFALALGLVIGFLSGLIGIGGGIILSPVLLMLGWANLKQTAAMSALFIVVNSASGLAGLGEGQWQLPELFRWLLPLTIVGGFLGAWAGSRRFNAPMMRYALATVLLIAAAKFLAPAVVSLQDLVSRG
jgi:uncharacterized membrane protein YfcA